MKKFIFLIFIIFHLNCIGQKRPVISYKEYMQMVEEHHPISRVADIRLETGEKKVDMARGAFDPKIEGQLLRKNFDGKRYYDILQGGVKIPTWMGVTVQGGYDQNEGVFLNPERFTPDQGLAYAGLSIAIGEGLLLDERRAGLRKAQLSQEMAVSERDLVFNELLYEAGITYWQWFMKHYSKEVYTEAVRLADIRLQAVKQAALLGDRPYIDTLEASIQFQTRTIQLQQADLEAKNAAALMSVFLWLDGQLPMVIDPQSVPSELDLVRSFPPDNNLIVDLERQVNQHPKLAIAAIEIRSSEIDLRWKREQLKPQLDLKYNALTESLGGTETTGFNANDFTLGISFSMPILLRKERANVAINSLKIEEKQLQLATKRQDVRVKVQMALNDWEMISQQLNLFERTARDYGVLLDGERDLFSAGESSLFMVNSRETKYVQAQVKLIELKSKNRMAELKTRFAMADIKTQL